MKPTEVGLSCFWVLFFIPFGVLSSFVVLTSTALLFAELTKTPWRLDEARNAFARTGYEKRYCDKPDFKIDRKNCRNLAERIDDAFSVFNNF